MIGAVPVAVSALLALASAVDSHAQEPAQKARQLSAEGVLEEVLVTARRREEIMQTTPIAVSAFNALALEYRGVTSLDEIERYVPNLTLQNNPGYTASSNVSTIYIRGVGQKDHLATVEPGVGLYLDGVYIARSLGAVLDVIDVEQIEVLRGPQGTLFGRNTIGGAISVNTVRPQIGGDFGGELGLAVGSDDRLNLKGALEVPLGDSLAIRASLASLEQDGYVTRQSDGADLGNEDTLTGRFALAWMPTESLSVDINADYSQMKTNAAAFELLGIDFTDLSQFNGLVASVPPPMVFIHNVTFAATAPGVPCAVTDVAGNGITSNPDSPNCMDERYLLDRGRSAATEIEDPELDVWGVAGTVAWDFSDSMTFKSITGWRELDSLEGQDGDISPHRIAHWTVEMEQEQFTQEFQLLGSHADWNWILGAYYFKEEGTDRNTLDFTVSNFLSGGAFDNESMALFAQATWDISDILHLTVGGRYTDEEKKFHPDQYILKNYFQGFSELVPPDHPLAALDAFFLQEGYRILPDLEKKIDVSEFTPMASLSWDVSDDVMIYGSYSEGFKSGGFTQRVFPPAVPGITVPAGLSGTDLIPTFDPEFVDAYELGLKSTFLEGRARLNAALFYSDYEDMQVQAFNSVAPVTKNVGAASIQGAELEMQLAPGEGWLIDVMGAWLDAKYDEIDSNTTLIDEGNAFERVPEWAANLGLSKEWLSSYGQWIARVDWSYRDEVYNDAYNTEIMKTDSYQLWDARLQWVSDSEDWTVIASGRNLSDEDYLVTGVWGLAFQTYTGVYNRGREYSLEVRWQF
ncbi:TonB-dependent receptor [Halioglobus maricola]|uniref:TonB-dependent receptor n=2 Tax=Halioglobus maricola TaxID=2601894 RepID=A0A5P9NR00_9GAMM|nr:TonB-dependent receptor [Halioglobus maricola]